MHLQLFGVFDLNPKKRRRTLLLYTRLRAVKAIPMGDSEGNPSVPPQGIRPAGLSNGA